MNTAKSTAGTRYTSTYRSIRNSKILSYALALFFFAMAVGSFMDTNGDHNLPMFFIWFGACVGSLISVRKIKRREETLKLREKVYLSGSLDTYVAGKKVKSIPIEDTADIQILVAELEEAIKRKHGIK